jgi:hypothetical protein
MKGIYELKAFLPSTTGLENVTVTPVNRDQHWYTLQGIKLDSRPQRRGLYITGGRKVFGK